MPVGGARGRSGPAPDPNALRRDRPADEKTWITLPAERTGPIPDWPLVDSPPSPAEAAYWERLWQIPQATQWEAHGNEVEVALYVRSLAESVLPGAAVNLRTLVKQLQEGLGLSLTGLQVRRWRLSTPTPAATATTSPTAARPARRGPSSRDRFRVVKPTEDD